MAAGETYLSCYMPMSIPVLQHAATRVQRSTAPSLNPDRVRVRVYDIDTAHAATHNSRNTQEASAVCQRNSGSTGAPCASVRLIMTAVRRVPGLAARLAQVGGWDVDRATTGSAWAAAALCRNQLKLYVQINMALSVSGHWPDHGHKLGI